MITSFIMRENHGTNREHESTRHPPDDLDPPARLPAVIPRGVVAVAADPVALVPALIAAAGWRYVEFFTANIRNPNTRRAYARVCSRPISTSIRRSVLN
jgi:hypothetical protein